MNKNSFVLHKSEISAQGKRIFTSVSLMPIHKFGHIHEFIWQTYQPFRFKGIYTKMLITSIILLRKISPLHIIQTELETRPFSEDYLQFLPKYTQTIILHDRMKRCSIYCEV